VNFNSLDYLVFLVAVVGAYYALGRRHLQNALLFGASWFFYGYVHPWMLWLLAAVTLNAWLGALAVGSGTRWRRPAMAAAVAINLGILAVFKYFNFFAANVAAVLRAGGLDVPDVYLDVLLPAGISFYTFQAIAYVVDVYRGERPAERNLLDLTVFLAFFPQLVAGPIERANTLLVQVKSDRRFDPANITDGLTLVIWGMFKKLVIGDNVAVIANKIFLLQEPGPLLLAIGVFAFGIQIYADFSGYTDIARGSARLLGFRLSENFRHPYLAQNPADFWRRWHITLSQWIRDYIYIPLGGNRVGGARLFANLMITMFLCGLWHGAQWNFVLWGLYHGALIYGYRLAAAAGVPMSGGGAWQAAARVLVMFALVHLGWALFREPDLAYLAFNLNPLASHADAPPLEVAAYLFALCALYALPLAAHALLDRYQVIERIAAGGRGGLALVRQAGFAAACLAAVAGMRATVTTDFIYFQF